MIMNLNLLESDFPKNDINFYKANAQDLSFMKDSSKDVIFVIGL